MSRARKNRLIRRKQRVSVVNTAGLIVAASFCVYALSLNSLPRLSTAAGVYLAAASVSVSAAVAPNPDNTLAQQLHQKQVLLDQRETQLAQREQSVGGTPLNMLGVYSLFASLILFVLVGINFYYDRRRDRIRNAPAVSFAVDLKAGR